MKSDLSGNIQREIALSSSINRWPSGGSGRELWRRKRTHHAHRTRVASPSRSARVARARARHRALGHDRASPLTRRRARLAVGGLLRVCVRRRAFLCPAVAVVRSERGCGVRDARRVRRFAARAGVALRGLGVARGGRRSVARGEDGHGGEQRDRAKHARERRVRTMHDATFVHRARRINITSQGTTR